MEIHSFASSLTSCSKRSTSVVSPFLYSSQYNFLQVSQPFFTILHKWIFSGELYDPCSEFFVAMDPELANMQYVHPSSLPGQSSGDFALGTIGGDMDDLSLDKDPRSKLWEAKYQFQQEMLPSFVGEAFGQKASCLSATIFFTVVDYLK
jgi:Gamma tubulin complex component N-terminal